MPDEAELQEGSGGAATGATGALFIVSTPIGNLGDITFRAVETLRSVGVVLCEDTRHSRRLLDHYAVGTSSAALHEHNEARESPRLIQRMLSGESMALISDAGTPLLSDPGARLVAAAIEAGVRVVPVPGASALLSALVGAGLPADVFTYVGFLARKGKERAAQLAMLSALPHTSVVYEAPNRVADTLNDVAEVVGAERRAVVARELSKHFEEFRRGTVRELADYYQGQPPRGEVVIVLEGRAPEPLDEYALRVSARTLRAGGATTRDIVRALVEQHGASRNLAYRLAQDVHV
ncbi:MAG: 16S rRNA (cytidine(1402)-2'-O)-methyltransferase [Gemmatimonadaceae bacterium]